MKRAAFWIVFVFVSSGSFSQDSLRRFEFGSTLCSIHSFNNNYYFVADRPGMEFLNGIFFRYSKNRIAYRGLASYSDNSYAYSSPPEWADGTSGDEHNKDFRIGAGIQYSLLKRKDWFYAFADLAYRNVYSSGHLYGGILGVAESYSKTINGADGFLGLGFKLRMLKNIYLSPEAGFLIASKFVAQTNSDLRRTYVTKFNYTEFDVSGTVRMHLTVRF